MSAIDTLRNHMLAATMHDRWETLTEIIRFMRADYGLVLTRLDAIGWLHELGKDGIHTLASRARGEKKEFRLYVKSQTIPVPCDDYKSQKQYLLKGQRKRRRSK